MGWKMELFSQSRHMGELYGPGGSVEVPVELAERIYQREGAPIPQGLQNLLSAAKKKEKSMPTRKVDLDEQYTYAGLAIGPGKDVEVTPEQYDWLVEQGAFGKGKPDTEPNAEGTGATGTPPEDQTTLSGRKGIENIGLAPEISYKLKEAGYATVASVRAATDEELDGVEGIGPATVEKIRAATA